MLVGLLVVADHCSLPPQVWGAPACRMWADNDGRVKHSGPDQPARPTAPEGITISGLPRQPSAFRLRITGITIRSRCRSPRRRHLRPRAESAVRPQNHLRRGRKVVVHRQGDRGLLATKGCREPVQHFIQQTRRKGSFDEWPRTKTPFAQPRAIGNSCGSRLMTSSWS